MKNETTLLKFTVQKEKIEPNFTSTEDYQNWEFTIQGEGKKEYVDKFLKAVQEMELK